MDVTIAFDTTNAAHREFLVWQGQTPGAARDAALLGHHVIVHGLIDTYCQTPQAARQLALLDERHRGELALKDRQIGQISQQLVSARSDEATAARVAEVSRIYQERIGAMQATLDAREAATNANDALRQQLAQREAEIELLRCGNHVKGATGEMLLLKYLERHFSEYTIVNRGRVGHEADIHMVNAKNEVVVVESKYKDRVTGLDIEKFYRDIAETSASQRVIGAVFVSIRSRSIPTKGSLAFEQRGSVPILFVGFDDEAELDALLCKYMSLFVDVACIVGAAEHGAVGDSEIIAQLAAPFAMVRKNRARIEKIKSEHLGAINRLVLEIEQDNIEILTAIEKIVGTGARKRRLQAAKQPLQTAPAAKHICEHCQHEFKTAGALKTHAHRCPPT